MHLQSGKKPKYIVQKQFLNKSQENISLGFPTRSDTNRTEQPQNMARGMKFWIQEEKRLYYLCSKNKGADQLCGGYHVADLRLCFCICKKQIFSLLTWPLNQVQVSCGYMRVVRKVLRHWLFC